MQALIELNRNIMPRTLYWRLRELLAIVGFTLDLVFHRQAIVVACLWQGGTRPARGATLS